MEVSACYPLSDPIVQPDDGHPLVNPVLRHFQRVSQALGRQMPLRRDGQGRLVRISPLRVDQMLHDSL